MSTTKGFRSSWYKQRARYRNATGGRKNAERKKLVNLVMEELKREVGGLRQPLEGLWIDRKAA